MGDGTPPTAFCRKYIRSARSFRDVPAKPPTQSEWPLRYLVVECTTTSNPSSRGRWKNGVMKVLSQTEISPRFFATSATLARSISFSIGLVGLSTQTSFVFGVIAGSRFSGFDRSTNEYEIPCRLKTLSKIRKVPPYTSSEHTT